MDVVTYALSRKYTDNSIAGTSGVLAGKNCTIASITPVDGGNLVTFEWVADDSTTHTDTMFVQDGILGENDIAPTYDPTVTYSEGNLVVYNNELYRCTSTTTGEFDPSDWESISINEILSEIEIALAGKADSGDVPTALSDLTDDSTHRTVTDTEKNTWNAKSDFSGSYNDLTDKPTIPSDADDISYDNTESGLEADDVQGAIDEVNGNIVDVEANPSGDATATLEKVQIDSTIYDFAASNVYGEVSGAVASFSDGANKPVKSLVVSIVPVQSGSGDPYPAGGGKNKYDKDSVIDNKVINSNGNLADSTNMCVSDYIPVDADTVYYLTAGVGSSSMNGGAFFDANKDFITIFNLSGSGTQSGTVTTGVTAAYVRINAYISRKGEVQFEKGSSGTSYQPYSNIRPISGWSAVGVTDAGGNSSFDNTSWVKGRLDNGVIGYAENTTSMTITDTGVTFITNSAYRGVVGGLTPVVGGNQYYFNFETTTSENLSAFIDYYDSNSQWISRPQFSNLFTPPSNCAYIRISFQGKTTGTFIISNVAIYSAITTTIQLGQTVYGGELDVTNGAGIKNILALDLSQLNYTYQSSSGVFRCTNCPSKDNNIICEIYKTNEQYLSWQLMPDFSIQTGPSDLIIKDSRYSDVDTFKAALANVDCVYKSSTSASFTTQPTQITTRLCTNNLWADSGNVINCKYIRDLNSTINILWNAVFNQSGTRSVSNLTKSAPSEELKNDEGDEKPIDKTEQR